MRIMNLLTKYIKLFYGYLRDITSFFYRGFCKKTTTVYLRFFVRLLVNKLNEFTSELKKFDGATYGYEGSSLERLKKINTGLHRILSKQTGLKYSILFPILNPDLSQLKKALQSVLDQTAPDKEILLGLSQKLPLNIQEYLKNCLLEHPTAIKQVLLSPEIDSIYVAYNLLSKKASGDYLFLMQEKDWMRTDLLFRYEQLLQIDFADVLYCNESLINEKDQIIEELRKPPLAFPYYFVNTVGRGVLISAAIWNKIGGFKTELLDAEEYDLMLRLDAAKAVFRHVPCPLYIRRKEDFQKKSHRDKNLVTAFRDYSKAKKLDWQISSGYKEGTVRAEPHLSSVPVVHAIILFKDKLDLVLAAVKSLFNQRGVQVKITALASQGSDDEIVKCLTAMGVEVLKIDEPFNYSRLNNYAIENSKISSEDEALLLFNDDVELEENAVLEMTRWLDQPQIGIVGCRLHYPAGPLQHGGVDLCRKSSALWHLWYHPECHVNFEESNLSRVIRICPAVTAAAVLIKRKVYLQVGGFDEVCYPITYSDTNLSVRLKAHGYLALYTPYAFGNHHESVSRGKHPDIEDFEKSSWLHHVALEKYLMDHKLPKDKFAYLEH
jgi:O-antigen biosynthesis protein